MFTLGGALEAFEAVVPEAFEKGAEFFQPLRAGTVQAAGTVASFAHEASLLEDAQVLRDRGARDIEVTGDLARGELLAPDEAEDLAAPGLGDGLEGSFHGHTVRPRLRKRQVSIHTNPLLVLFRERLSVEWYHRMRMSQSAEPEVAEEATAEEPMLPAADETIFRMRQAVHDGEPWFSALLDAVGRWRVPEETIGDRHYRYLIGGEAFDWLLLAERLLDEMPDLVPPRERDALLFFNRWPMEIDNDDFAERLGAAKHSAHLNFLYGLLVEEALQLAIEEDIHKENRNRVVGQDRRVDETMLERVYGKPREELFAQFYEETGTLLRENIAYDDWREFVYWLFKMRLRRQDKARVASDTRRGLAQLTRMELAISERRHGAQLDEADFAQRYSA